MPFCGDGRLLLYSYVITRSNYQSSRLCLWSWGVYLIHQHPYGVSTCAESEETGFLATRESNNPPTSLALVNVFQYLGRRSPPPKIVELLQLTRKPRVHFPHPLPGFLPPLRRQLQHWSFQPRKAPVAPPARSRGLESYRFGDSERN